jgi:hypothetical protein
MEYERIKKPNKRKTQKLRHRPADGAAVGQQRHELPAAIIALAVTDPKATTVVH